IEKLMLNPQQNRSETRKPPIIPRCHTCHADERIQFVHRPIAIDSKNVLGNALAADERCLALVAALCVDAIKRKPRLAEFTHRNARSKRVCTSFSEECALSSSEIFSRRLRNNCVRSIALWIT